MNNITTTTTLAERALEEHRRKSGAQGYALAEIKKQATKKLEAAAAGAAEYRARRKSELLALVAEIDLVQLAEKDPALDMPTDLRMDRARAEAVSELDTLAAIESQLARRADAVARVSRVTIQSTLPLRPEALDDVMIVAGTEWQGSLFRQRIDELTEIEFHTPRHTVCYVPRAEYESFAKPRIDAFREMKMRQWQSDPPCTPQRFDRDVVCVIEGAERWNPTALYKRLHSFEPTNLHGAAASWCVKATQDVRTLVRWQASFVAQGFRVGELESRLAEMATRAEHTEKPQHADAWWRAALAAAQEAYPDAAAE